MEWIESHWLSLRDLSSCPFLISCENDTNNAQLASLEAGRCPFGLRTPELRLSSGRCLGSASMSEASLKYRAYRAYRAYAGGASGWWQVYPLSPPATTTVHPVPHPYYLTLIHSRTTARWCLTSTNEQPTISRTRPEAQVHLVTAATRDVLHTGVPKAYSTAKGAASSQHPAAQPTTTIEHG